MKVQLLILALLAATGSPRVDAEEIATEDYSSDAQVAEQDQPLLPSAQQAAEAEGLLPGGAREIPGGAQASLQGCDQNRLSCEDYFQCQLRKCESDYNSTINRLRMEYEVFIRREARACDERVGDQVLCRKVRAEKEAAGDDLNFWSERARNEYQVCRGFEVWIADECEKRGGPRGTRI